MLHDDLVEGDIHQLQNWEHSTRATRESATYEVTDIGKISYQTDEGSYWLVTSATPTFRRIDMGDGVATSTIDATETTAWSYTMPDDSRVYVVAKCVAMETDGSNGNVYHIAGLFKRESAGAATQQGSTADIISAIEEDATWGVAEFDVDSNDIRLRVTGAASTNITWIPEVQITLVV